MLSLLGVVRIDGELVLDRTVSRLRLANIAPGGAFGEKSISS